MGKEERDEDGGEDINFTYEVVDKVTGELGAVQGEVGLRKIESRHLEFVWTTPSSVVSEYS